MAKLWGGRFSLSSDDLAARLNNSISFDWRLATQDIEGSIAWCNALLKAGILNEEEQSEIVQGLKSILSEVKQNKFNLLPSDEDVHTAIERRLGELIGLTAGKLHTGRSRNDQVVTDFNLWLKSAVVELDSLLKNLQSSILQRAKHDTNIIMPGYTHFQRAQPILVSHWWLSHFWPLQRDRENLVHTYDLADVMPLGSGALAGTPFPTDRHALARELGFSKISLNSIDAVASRDAAASFLFSCAMISTHLSRLAEALILYTTTEFGFFELSDAFSTGSSLMPQKKNPDPLELIRAKAGAFSGRLVGFLSVLKGLPSAYDKDLQEDKLAVFESMDSISMLLPVMAAILDTLTIHPERMKSAIDSTMLTTDLADYLVTKGIPFREAHHIVGRIVAYADSIKQPLQSLSIDQFRTFHPVFTSDVYQVFDPYTAVAKRNTIGGTSPNSINQQIDAAEKAVTRLSYT